MNALFTLVYKSIMIIEYKYKQVKKLSRVNWTRYILSLSKMFWVSNRLGRIRSKYLAGSNCIIPYTNYGIISIFSRVSESHLGNFMKICLSKMWGCQNDCILKVQQLNINVERMTRYPTYVKEIFVSGYFRCVRLSAGGRARYLP